MTPEIACLASPRTAGERDDRWIGRSPGRNGLVVRLWTAAFVAAKLLLAWPAAAAGDAVPVQFAGFAVTGDAAGENSTVEILSPAIRGDAAIARNQRLLTQVAADAPRWIRLETNGLAALDGSTTSTAVAAAIDREAVVVEKVGEQYKLVAEISGQALFFDFREKQVVASVPVTVQHIDVLDTAPDGEAQKSALLRLLDDAGPNGLTAVMAKAIAGARLPNAAARRMQLVGVTAADGAFDGHPVLADRIRSGVVGHEFSKHFAAGTGLALLPFRSGQAIGSAMAARFADGSVYALRIPEPDYAIHLRIDRVAQRAIEKTAALERRLYGVFFTLWVEEPLSGRRYLDQPLRQGATKLIPATQTVIDDAAAYYDTLLEAFASVAAASQGGADQWVSEQPGGRDARSQWKQFEELIEQCR